MTRRTWGQSHGGRAGPWGPRASRDCIAPWGAPGPGLDGVPNSGTPPTPSGGAQGRAPRGGYSRERLAGVILPSIPYIILPVAPNLGARLCPLPGSSESPITERRSGIWMHEFIMTTFSSMTTVYLTTVFFSRFVLWRNY